jgi:hypothetical protein
LGVIWQHFQRKETVTPGKFSAHCNYCPTTWKRGEVPTLEEYLASHCQNVPLFVLREYITKIQNREKISNKKRKLSEGQKTLNDFHDSVEIPEGRINRINRALIKFFVACGIAYRVVEHPFFIDFISELNAGYILPTREYLSGRLLENELCRVNSKIDEDLENQTNLTLGKTKNNYLIIIKYKLFIIFFL